MILWLCFMYRKKASTGTFAFRETESNVIPFVRVPTLRSVPSKT